MAADPTPPFDEQPLDDPTPSAAARTMRNLGRGAQATGAGVMRLVRFARRQARAQGAGESGLARIIELHTFNTAGDAAVAIALAGTLFFAQPGEARDQVALFLGLTMLPFAIVAPLLGPFLDRFSHGRRWSIGATMALRAFFVWLLADAVASDSLLLFPLALGCLVASKSYGVARAAAIPRVLPPGLTLVKANSRISLSGVIGAGVSAPIAGLAATIGPQWTLRYAFVVFAIATILAILLPSQVDSTSGEHQVSIRRRHRQPQLPAPAAFGLRCNAGLRVLSGFLTMFMAFLIQQSPLPGWEGKTTLLMGLVAAAAGAGNTLGIATSALLRRVNPRIVVTTALIADAIAAIVTTFHFTLGTVVILGLTAGVCQSMGKLALDALIQQHVPERYRTSAFARSETLIQLSWVVGGFIGIAMPMHPTVGFGVLSALMIGFLVAIFVRTYTATPPPPLELTAGRSTPPHP